MLTGMTSIMATGEIHGLVGPGTTLIALNASQIPMAVGGKLLKVVFGAILLMQQSSGPETVARSPSTRPFVNGGVSKVKGMLALLTVMRHRSRLIQQTKDLGKKKADVTKDPWIRSMTRRRPKVQSMAN